MKLLGACLSVGVRASGCGGAPAPREEAPPQIVRVPAAVSTAPARVPVATEPTPTSPYPPAIDKPAAVACTFTTKDWDVQPHDLKFELLASNRFHCATEIPLLVTFGKERRVVGNLVAGTTVSVNSQNAELAVLTVPGAPVSLASGAALVVLSADLAKCVPTPQLRNLAGTR